MDKKKLIGHLLAAFSILVWGSTFISSKILLQAFTPIQIIVLRCLIAYIVLWLLHPKWEKIVWKQEVGVFLMSLFSCTIYFLAENNALRFTQAANVSILVAFSPILTAILAHFFTKGEKLHRNIWFGFAIAFFGVILVVFNGAFVLQLNPVGDLLSLTAALCWAVYAVLLKKYGDGYSNITLNRKLMFYGLLTALPIMLTEGKPLQWDALGQGVMLLNVLFLGILGSGICYVTWTIANKRLGIVATSNYIYFNPFVTLVAAGFFLKESVTLVGIIGAVLIIGGVVLSGIRGKKQLHS